MKCVEAKVAKLTKVDLLVLIGVSSWMQKQLMNDEIRA